MTTLSITRRAAASLAAAALATPALARTADDRRFAAFSQRYLDQTLALTPVRATGLGDHRWDSRVDDLSAPARALKARLLRRLMAEADRFEAGRLSRDDQVDLAMIRNQLRYDLWTDETLQSWAWDPQVYTSVAGGAIYSLMARDFAPRPQRLRAAIGRMAQVPALLAQMRGELQPARVPRIHAETVARQNPGIYSVVADMVLPHAGDLTAGEQAQLKIVAADLKAAVEAHQVWLDQTLVPQAAGNFRIGAELYDQKLAFALMSSLSRADIRSAAERALSQTRAEMYDLSRRILGPTADGPDNPDAATQQRVIEAALERAYLDHASRETLVEASRAATMAATDFVRAKDLITLPDAPVEIILMPEFQRGYAVAYCDSPGPLDRHLPTFYAVSPIPPDWSQAQAESFLREYNRRGIHDIAIHEAMPGHYVQIWHSNRHPSVVRAVLASGSFVEGWAVYAEDVMAKAGYMDGDPLFRLQQLKVRVRTITNAILDQMVHVDGATEAEVMTFLTSVAFQQEREAAGKWTRARLDSTQLPSYFVGVAEHDALRAEAERRAGDAFNLKAYHDKALSFGSPPGRFVRQLMFGEPIG